jgi:hypothetical protein
LDTSVSLRFSHSFSCRFGIATVPERLALLATFSVCPATRTQEGRYDRSVAIVVIGIGVAEVLCKSCRYE